MANKNIEIEIQVNVENSKPLIEFLEKNGNFQSEKRQVDEYFSPAHRDFLVTRPVAEWLRLRDAEGKYSFNYRLRSLISQGKMVFLSQHLTAIRDNSGNYLGATQVYG